MRKGVVLLCDRRKTNKVNDYSVVISLGSFGSSKTGAPCHIDRLWPRQLAQAIDVHMAINRWIKVGENT